MADYERRRDQATVDPLGDSPDQPARRRGGRLALTRLRPVTRCPHGRVTHWGDHGPDPRDGTVGAEVCIPCSPSVLELRDALERIASLTGDVRVRRIAREALDRTTG